MDKHGEITLKTQRLVSFLASQNLGGVLLNSRWNFSWLTAGGRNGIDLSRELGSGSLLVRSDGRRFLLANRIEMPRLLVEELDANYFEPIEFGWEDEKASSDFLVEKALSLLCGNTRLGTDTPSSSEVPVVESALARCRYQLTASELDRFSALAQDAGVAIGQLVRELKPGESENQVARRVVDALGAYEITPIVTLVAGDERLKQFRHPVPTANTWNRVLMVVVCASRSGLVASLTRLISVGPPGSDLKRRIEAVGRVNAELMAATQPGTTGADLYQLVARVYAEQGFPGEEHRHHQGGACGYRTRDWVAHPTCQEVVQLHQTFAWNPSVAGAKAEETCVVRDNGVEVISRSPDWPQLSIEVAGREYLSPDVLSIS